VPVLFVGAWLLVSAWCVVFLGLKVFAPCVPGGIMQKPLLYVLPLLLFWPLQRVAFGTLGWVARAYERKVFSDAQFQAMVWMLTFPICIAFTLTNAEDGGPLDAQSFGVFPAVIVGAGVYIYLSKRIRPWPYPIQLLLLRVFASDTRGEQLLDEVAFRWRFFGPIRMIGGPDLAQSNLAPHKLLRFLRRQLVEQFISDRQTLLAHIAALDERPDPDAPYRINEFFCFDNTWQDAVAHLLERSDTVLLDLRGFTKARRGTAVEIALLAQRGALDCTVFLIDHETDRDAVAHALAEVPGASMPERHILQMDGKLQGADIFKALVSAVGGPRHGRPKDL
jgi:hypothetical protein